MSGTFSSAAVKCCYSMEIGGSEAARGPPLGDSDALHAHGLPTQRTGYVLFRLLLLTLPLLPLKFHALLRLLELTDEDQNDTYCALFSVPSGRDVHALASSLGFAAYLP